MKITYLSACVIIVSATLILSGCAVGIEKPKYTVLEKQGRFEVRQYPPQLIAETIVDADFEDAGNIAFKRLYSYISGNNKKKESISMTAPVSQQNLSEKISMTAPVIQTPFEGKYAVSFLMPSKYTLETLPEPLDPSVTIKQVPAQTMAAVRYSGTWSQEKYQKQKASLEKFIQQKNLTPTADPIFARYNPPFELWFLKRNEVLIPIKDPK